MKFSLFLLPFFVLVTGGAGPVLSEETPYRLEDIVVTASRVASPLREAPANVTVITSDDIEESGAQTIADVLQQEPGVFTQNLLGNPKGAKVDIRGYGEAAPQNVLVLVNGRRVNGIDLSGADLAQIPVDAIERIEVYRGPGTVLYGDNAVGGVVNIILKAGEGPAKVITSMTGGSYNYFKPEMILSGKQGKFSYLTTISSVETQGYRHNNEFYAKDALGNFRFEALRNLAFSLSAGHHRDSYGQPGALYWSDLRQGAVDLKDSTHPKDTASTEDNFIDLEPELRLRDDVVLFLGGSYRDRHTASFFDYGYGGFTDLKSQLQTYAFTPKVVISTPLCRMKSVLVLGSDYYKYATTVNSFGGAFFQSKSDIDKRDFAYYADEKLSLLRDLILEAGYRRQRSTYDVDYVDFVDPLFSEAGTTHHDREAYRFSINYSFADKMNVFVTYNRGFRFPATEEFVIPGYSLGPGFFVPTQINGALKPQTTREFDTGIRWNPMAMVGVAVTYFQIRNKDEIYLNPLTFANENYDKTKRQGVEASLSFNPTAGLLINLAYSYTEALFDGGPFDGNRMPSVPKDKFSAKVSYSIADWDFSLASVYTGDRYAISDQENGREKLPGYTTFDATIGYRFRALSALLAVKNLTDKQYSEFGAYSTFRRDIGLYPSPGRQFFLTLKYALGG